MTTPTAKNPLSAEKVRQFALEIAKVARCSDHGETEDIVPPTVQRIAAAGAEAERERLNAEWLDRARRYFDGIRDPKPEMRGWNGTEADFVMHEVWKRRIRDEKEIGEALKEAIRIRKEGKRGE